MTVLTITPIHSSQSNLTTLTGHDSHYSKNPPSRAPSDRNSSIDPSTKAVAKAWVERRQSARPHSSTNLSATDASRSISIAALGLNERQVLKTAQWYQSLATNVPEELSPWTPLSQRFSLSEQDFIQSFAAFTKSMCEGEGCWAVEAKKNWGSAPGNDTSAMMGSKEAALVADKILSEMDKADQSTRYESFFKSRENGVGEGSSTPSSSS